jgi:hypothetical protein
VEREREGEGTKFTIDRKLFSSDIWFASPWKLKIWIYLVGNANYKAGSFMGVDIERGQLIRSYRTIAKDCGYKIGYRLKKPSLTTVRRICEELTKEGRTHSRTVHCGTLFTIINYNDLQPFLDARTVQAMAEQRYNGGAVGVRNNKNKKVNKEKKEEPSRSNKNKFEQNSIPVLLSGILLSFINSRNGNFKKPNIQNWAADIDKMIRIDKRVPCGIMNIICWSQADAFWQNNILSAAKLRKQYDQLKMRMLSISNLPKGKQKQLKNAAVSREWLENGK